MEDLLFLIVVIAAITLGIILVLRELSCWYFKINERMALEREMIAQLSTIAARLTPPAVDIAVKDVKVPGKTEKTFREYVKTVAVKAENDLLAKIHQTYKDKKYTACKNYCKELVKRFPKSEYADFAAKRIAALPWA